MFNRSVLVMWAVTQCGLLVRKLFGGTYYLSLQGSGP
jgi:hypothetical protein